MTGCLLVCDSIDGIEEVIVFEGADEAIVSIVGRLDGVIVPPCLEQMSDEPIPEETNPGRHEQDWDITPEILLSGQGTHFPPSNAVKVFTGQARQNSNCVEVEEAAVGRGEGRTVPPT